MFQTRDEERPYAFLNDKESKKTNRYGKKIDLVEPGDELFGKSLNINGDSEVSDSVAKNPNRYKQHGFHFTADNCIGCHACEAACSEKNDNPAHIAFRSVGYVEGGTYPSYQRINISMACNHCDDPVCLKGCPTRAYTKFAEYGAVLQDPDICFGCGYCTWVCPYNAPQLDPVKGQVSKCNMCVDRLEVGLKPACVSACLGNALDFGVIENIPEQREQAKTDIPGLPRTDITKPNIRFQQTRSTHREMTRTDSMPIKYHRNDKTQSFEPVIDDKHGKKRQWNFVKLSSRENPLVLFTLVTQAVVGAFLLFFAGPMVGLDSLSGITGSAIFIWLLAFMLLIEILGLVMSTMHLGKPHRFYRAFNNLKHSPVSREVAGVALFFNSLLGYAFFSLFGSSQFSEVTDVLMQLCAYAALFSGPVALYFMHKIYRIQARPFWNHWQVLSAFYGSMLSLGGLLLGLTVVPYMAWQGIEYLALLTTLASVMALGLAIEAIGHILHARDMRRSVINGRGAEGGAAQFEQETRFGKTYGLRNALLAINFIAVMVLASGILSAAMALSFWLVIASSMLISAVIGRALFYVLVIPTTMPGAFFWKNKAFQEHARETGLAHREECGVVYESH
ncbi:MAG: dimethyl sulfoxide reductase anchor subunit [Gammaproteobacteria bacterium]|nr:dimethyl sulfoxide reductase anchor subunit [Gammaproteobacteria bacterium]